MVISKRVLITGATGIIGRKLVEELLQSKTRQKGNSRKYKLRILTRKTQSINFEKGDIELVHGDLLDLNSLLNAAKDIEIVVHLAGITHTNNQSLYYKVNAQGTDNLLKACQSNKVIKFIYISSSVACCDGSAYSKSKLLAEKKVEQSSLSWLILRLSEVYGAGDKETISTLINIIKKSYLIPVIGSGNYSLCPVYVDDVTRAIVNCMDNDGIMKKKYLIAGPEEMTYNEIVNRLIKMLKVRRLKIYLPLFFIKFLTFVFSIFNNNKLVKDQLPRLLCKKSADISSARRDISFNPRDFEIGIRDMLNL